MRQVFRFAAIARVTGVWTPAQAVDYCVGTQSELQAALNSAESDASDSVIKTRSGLTSLTSDLRYEPENEFFLPAGSLTVRGGYNVDCSEYSIAAGATQINGGTVRKLTFVTQTGAVSMAGLTLQGTHLLMSSRVLGDCPSNASRFLLRCHRLRCQLRVEYSEID